MRSIWLAATAGVWAVSGGAAAAQQLAPPISPGEHYIETANGCGVVLREEDFTPGYTLLTTRDFYAKNRIVWYGRCVDGLVDGEGEFVSSGGAISGYTSEYILGRRVGPTKSHDAGDQLTRYHSGDRWVEIFDGAKPFGPRWGYYSKTLYAPGMESSIESAITRCVYGLEKQTKKFGCSQSNKFGAYAITVKLGGQIKTVVCPDPRTSEGCDKLWMAQGKPVFDAIQAFVEPIEAALASRRSGYQALITPEWRAQAEARQSALLANGNAAELRDRIAGAVVANDLPGARSLFEQLSTRFPGSPSLEQAKLHLTALYCAQSAPMPMLTVQDAAETTRIFQTEPCRRTKLAESRLISSLGMLESAKDMAAADAVHDAKVAAYAAEQRRERDAYWGSMLGVITGVLTNAVAPPAAAPTYSSGAAASPGYGSGSASRAYPGQSASGGSAESVAHNPANEARSCLVAIDKSGFAANRVSSVMGAVFRNSCAYSVEVTWCVEGGDCRPGYSNIMTVLGNSDRSISYDASRPGRINWAACRLGFTTAQSTLSRTMQHACK